MKISQDQAALDEDDMKKAMKAFRKELEAHKIKRDKKGVANAHIKLGILHSMKGDKRKAFDEYNRAIAICEETGDESTRATCLGNMGILYFTEGNMENAEKFFLDASEIHERLGKKEELASDSINLGLLYTQKDEFVLALDSYKKAASFIDAGKDYELLADVYLKIAHCYNRTGELLDSVSYYEKALENFKKAKSPDFEAAINGIMENKMVIALSKYNEKKELAGESYQDAISILMELEEEKRLEVLIKHLKYLLAISPEFVDIVFERNKILGDKVYGSLVPLKFAALALNSDNPKKFIKELDPQIQGIVVSILKNIERKKKSEGEQPEIV